MTDRITMHGASVPLFTQMLGTLSKLLDKAEAHAANRKIESDALLRARLAPDMHPLIGQVQLACDFAKGATARLAGVTAPSYQDNETTFDELRVRITKTLAFIHAVEAKSIDGSEAHVITLPFGGKPLTLKGQDYLVGYATPSVVFHVATAYAILRHNGVELGKADFLGQLLARSAA